MELKTPLYDTHVAEGGKIVPFAGYLLPIQYKTGVVKEHMAVREAAGLFDVSHMGEILVQGKGALKSLNHMFTNDFTDMPLGRVRYSVMCNEAGGCVDDLVVYKFGEKSYFVVVNAANKDKDFAHIKANILEDTEVTDISANVAQLALQGPVAKEIAKKLLPEEVIPVKYYTAVCEVSVKDIPCMISRTGYTGSFGYEFYTAARDGAALWKVLREAGEEFGLIPCGLGARDTLRLEASMPLYGHEMDGDVSPLEADLGFVVKLNKDEFIGRSALIAKGEPARIRLGLEVTGRGIVREHQDVYKDGIKIGITTSGTYCPYLAKSLAMIRVAADSAKVGDEVDVDVRGKRVAAKIVPMPFYKSADPVQSKEDIAELRRRVSDVASGKAVLKEHELIEAD